MKTLSSMEDNTDKPWFINAEANRLMAWEYIHTVLLQDRAMSVAEITEKTGLDELQVARILASLQKP